MNRRLEASSVTFCLFAHVKMPSVQTTGDGWGRASLRSSRKCYTVEYGGQFRQKESMNVAI